MSETIPTNVDDSTYLVEIGSFLETNATVIGAVSDILIPVIGLGFALAAYFWNKRKDKLQFFEQSFADLQNINNMVLSSADSMSAAVESIWPGEEIDEKEVRIVYMHFVRINRLFRAWNYWQQGVIKEKQAVEIVRSHVSVLKHHEKYLPVMLTLGYPEKFQEFLVKLVEQAEPVAPLFSEIISDKEKTTSTADDA